MITKTLNDMYNTMTLGVPFSVPDAKTGRVNPINLAKQMGRSRQIHFKDTEAAH